ncbi:bifunctional UDP-N-acetylglucosamine diphosphorylase/glucosamine-1-phosphate N-acetyltransferase GlmU [Aestuariimicrobium ganziense]|uniref:bifunctional UDP-N-acetylglucosamine diphosphorylase/glucosamine-1-phosphate N-acetyltransferase GlmU n=1 Tax=Aestuariimicrobium ganziense TaxID=2773677 RepID=UPI0019453A5A|nr:bifunctional UDP-N-acetylglucosamine diphosphorylase/glucosamine-1-phosphate N-acetyltransferase GlmU [Aestuariimicrobium ganziense]
MTSDPSTTQTDPEQSSRSVAAVVVLAAGGGTRMKSSTSKLLHKVAGHSMLSYAVSAAQALQPQRLVVVVGHEREQVLAHLDDIAPHVSTAVQDQQNGTGHAVQCGLADLGELDGEVVVTYGDVPMLTGETLVELVEAHRAAGAKATVLTAHVDDPYGYGRIVRDGERVARIVEQKDCSDDEASITEINSGIYVFDADTLRHGLGNLTTDNAQGELYLTDVITIANQRGELVTAKIIDDVWQTEGVNDRVQLARMNREMNNRIVEGWMRAGVTVVDPATTWIHASVDLAQDVTILPNTTLEGATSVATGATIGPDTTLVDVEVGEGATVIRTHGTLAVIGAGADVGPFSYLRPGTQLGAKGKIGAFVETKNAVIGDGAKVPHLAYAGDAVIDAGANIGAGTIFANYDGLNKSTTHVGANAFVGSNSVLVAPVDIGAGAFVAAGSTVTDDVGAGNLAVARGRQHASEGWIGKRRPGSKWDEAAKASDGQVHPKVTESRAKAAEKNQQALNTQQAQEGAQ